MQYCIYQSYGYRNPEFEMRNNFDREGHLQVSIKLIFDKLA